MSLSREDIRKVALLARLRLADHELDVLTPQLSQILEFVEQLGQLDTSGVEPMAHAVELSNVLAQDLPHASLPREVALANSPKHDGEFYRVPAVLGE